MKKLFLISLIIVSCINPVYSLSLRKQNTGVIQSEKSINLATQADVYYAQNDINEAKNLLLSVPENERTEQNWLLLGNIFQDEGKFNEAEFMYKKAIDVNDKYYKAYYNLGVMYMQQDKPNTAIEYFTHVVRLRPDYSYGHYNLACAYIKLEKYSKARFELLDAIEHKNNVPEFHYNLAYVYKKMKNERAAKMYLEYYNDLISKSIY